MAIAPELGIIQDASEAITGAELDAIPDEEMQQAVRRYGVTPVCSRSIRCASSMRGRPTAPLPL